MRTERKIHGLGKIYRRGDARLTPTKRRRRPDAGSVAPVVPRAQSPVRCRRARRAQLRDRNPTADRSSTMNANRSPVVRIVWIAMAVIAVGGTVAYAAIVVFRQDAFSEYIGLRGGPAQLTARILKTPVGETTGAWHYHPGYVYNVVTEGTITIEDGCGQVRQY